MVWINYPVDVDRRHHSETHRPHTSEANFSLNFGGFFLKYIDSLRSEHISFSPYPRNASLVAFRVLSADTNAALSSDSVSTALALLTSLLREHAAGLARSYVVATWQYVRRLLNPWCLESSPEPPTTLHQPKPMLRNVSPMF
jgi:hypothetical protein